MGPLFFPSGKQLAPQKQCGPEIKWLKTFEVLLLIANDD